MTGTAWPLQGKTALVTGVSRRKGIGYAVARRLASEGASVFFSHFSPHDDDQPWGGDDLGAVRGGIRDALQGGARTGDASADFSLPDAPGDLFERALGLTGSVDILVCNHARSGSDGSLLDQTPAMLDAHYAVNARSTILLTRRFAQAFGGAAEMPGERVAGDPVDEKALGRVVWFVSGQARPMPGEVAYAASKAMLAGLVPTLAYELVQRGIALNAINPGPVNTGYLDADTLDRPREAVEQAHAGMPLGRFGEPDDPARLVSWLVSDEGRWMIGQVLTHDSGFSL